MAQRKATVKRTTKETDVRVELNLDRTAPPAVSTTIPFLDHMLELMAHHGKLSLRVKASGDTVIDDHHLVEDIGITLGQALARALGGKTGITRYGNFLLPMDEALSYVALDLSGRPFLDYGVTFKHQKEGFDYDLIQDFFQALSSNAGMTLHIAMKRGRNNHHMAESVFKGFGRALAQAVEEDRRQKGVPSTKGRL